MPENRGIFQQERLPLNIIINIIMHNEKMEVQNINSLEGQGNFLVAIG